MNVLYSVTSCRVLSFWKSKLCKKRRINIWNYRSPYLRCRPSCAVLPSDIYGSITKWHLWRQNTIPLKHRDHLVGNRYFVPFFVFLLYRFRNARSAFYTRVRVLYLSPCFMPSPQSADDLYWPNLRLFSETLNRSLRSKEVYKASWWDCDDCYIGKTKRRLHDRKTEHFRALTSNSHSSAIADHMTQIGHRIKWDHCDTIWYTL